ncbi:DUF6338 family protein [Streptomyces sp. NBC_00322]|uniref:DUF6338 family protein n=1 Tax=Streptomyces sp. NBC_00322 TaxID=2975712 RepID=UPI002E2A4DAA|nr:DUF6338 family protein [Streptomyces sp. NBC_00322]
MVPSTVQQLAVLLVMVLPGGVYQAVRERLRGPRPSEVQVESRVLRAVAASVVLDSLYAVVAGPWLVSLTGGQGFAGVAARSRQAGIAALVLVVAVPAAAAWAEARWRARRKPSRRRKAPTAWDHLFSKRSSCFVRIRLKDGSWVAGWYGSSSCAAAFPHDRDIFLQAQYAVLADGRIGPRLDGTGGIYIPKDSIDLLGLLEPPCGAGTSGVSAVTVSGNGGD